MKDRATRRNEKFGRRPQGNTTPTIRRLRWHWDADELLQWLRVQVENGQSPRKGHFAQEGVMG